MSMLHYRKDGETKDIILHDAKSELGAYDKIGAVQVDGSAKYFALRSNADAVNKGDLTFRAGETTYYSSDTIAIESRNLIDIFVLIGEEQVRRLVFSPEGELVASVYDTDEPSFDGAYTIYSYSIGWFDNKIAFIGRVVPSDSDYSKSPILITDRLGNYVEDHILGTDDGPVLNAPSEPIIFKRLDDGKFMIVWEKYQTSPSTDRSYNFVTYNADFSVYSIDNTTWEYGTIPKWNEVLNHDGFSEYYYIDPFATYMRIHTYDYSQTLLSTNDVPLAVTITLETLRAIILPDGNLGIVYYIETGSGRGVRLIKINVTTWTSIFDVQVVDTSKYTTMIDTFIGADGNLIFCTEKQQAVDDYDCYTYIIDPDDGAVLKTGVLAERMRERDYVYECGTVGDELIGLVAKHKIGTDVSHTYTIQYFDYDFNLIKLVNITAMLADGEIPGVSSSKWRF